MIHLRLALSLLATAALAQRAEFVRIPPGVFKETRFERPFRIGKTEVSVGQFGAFVKATGYRTVAERTNSARTWRTTGFKVSAHQPVVYVTVEDAQACCRWMGARLPSDAEWEYAARAGATTRHYWGDAIDGRFLWYRANSNGRPHAVGRKLPNAWGLYDVEGNVWEWAISNGERGEPVGNRRGGSWIACENIEPAPGGVPSPLIGLSKSYQVALKYSDLRYDDIGFRCARSEP